MMQATTGPYDRKKDGTIARTDTGHADNTSTPLQASDQEIARIREKLGTEHLKEKEDLEKQLERPKHGTA